MARNSGGPRTPTSHPHPAEFGVNVATPIRSAEDRTVFVSSAYNGGSRLLKLARKTGKVAVDEIWSTKRVQIHFGNAVRLGPRVYASVGDFGAGPFAAIDAATGEMVWRDRAVGRATPVGAGDKLVILDEDGNLAAETPGPTGLTIHAKSPVLSERAWTVPPLSVRHSTYEIDGKSWPSIWVFHRRPTASNRIHLGSAASPAENDSCLQ